MALQIFFVLNEDISNLVDYVEHCKELSRRHPVTLICNGNRNHVDLGDTRLVEIESARFPLVGSLMFFIRCWTFLRQQSDVAAVVVCRQSRFVSLLPLRARAFEQFRFVFDLRSGSVTGRLDGVKDWLLGLEARAFSHHVVIHELVARQVLGAIPPGSLVLGVAAPRRKSDLEKKRTTRTRLGIGHETLVLLYVGTLFGRRLHDFVRNLTYDEADYLLLIVGSGPTADAKALDEALRDVAANARTPGYVSYDELDDYFAVADIGICYIPCESRFTNQPPTKLYEYIAADLGVIMTPTLFAESLPETLRDATLMFEPGLALSRIRNFCNTGGRSNAERLPVWHALTVTLEHYLRQISETSQ